MSIAGIASSSLFQNSVVQQTQNRFQQIQSQFQKLGQDLQAGNLTQAQSDFATLSQELPNGGQLSSQAASSSSTSSTSSTASSSSNPILQAFQSLGQDLQSGNLSAAQQESPPFNRARSKRKLPATRITAITIITQAAAATATPALRPPRSSKTSPRSVRISNPEISHPHSKPTLRCNPTCSSSCRALRLAPVRRRARLRHPQPQA